MPRLRTLLVAIASGMLLVMSTAAGAAAQPVPYDFDREPPGEDDGDEGSAGGDRPDTPAAPGPPDEDEAPAGEGPDDEGPGQAPGDAAPGDEERDTPPQVTTPEGPAAPDRVVTDVARAPDNPPDSQLPATGLDVSLGTVLAALLAIALGTAAVRYARRRTQAR